MMGAALPAKGRPMRLSRIALLVPALILAAACVPLPADAPTPIPDTCGAARFAGLIGAPLSAFDPRQAVGAVRIIAPGMMVTQDYSPSRINIHHDHRAIITRIACG